MNLLLFLFAALVVVAIVVAIVRRHMAVPSGSGFLNQLWGGFHASATLVVARLVAIASAGFELLAQGADLFNAPGLQDSVRGVMPANAWPWVLLGVGLITELARRRTL